MNTCLCSKNAYVIGGNHHNTLGVIRSLGRVGVSVYLLLVTETLAERAYVTMSKYIKNYRRFTKYDDVVDFLIEHMTSRDESYREIIICCSDGASSAVDLRYDELSKYYVCPNALKQGEISRLMSKEVMSEYARKIGLTIPDSHVVSREMIPEDLNFPIIIKPLYSIDGSKSDIRTLNCREELMCYLDSQPKDKRFQVQLFIDKEFEYQLIGCSIDNGKQVVIPGVARIIRPSKVSNTGFLKYDYLDDSFDVVKSKELISATGYSGLFSVEFIRGKDGTDYFLEINFRNDGNAICVTAAGVNLPYLWYRCSAGTIDDDFKYDFKPVFVMPEFDDLLHVYHGNINFLQWWKDLCRTDAFMEYDKSDKKPFFTRIADYICLLLKKIIERIR